MGRTSDVSGIHLVVTARLGSLHLNFARNEALSPLDYCMSRCIYLRGRLGQRCVFIETGPIVGDAFAALPLVSCYVARVDRMGYLDRVEPARAFALDVYSLLTEGEIEFQS